MFRVIYANDKNFPYGYYREFSQHETLEEAKAARKVSGDLVVDDEGSIVTDRGWLFDWELEPHPEPTKTHYAVKCIEKQEKIELPYLFKMKQLRE